MAGKTSFLTTENAWNTVALEERIQLISKVQAEGILAALTVLLCIGAIAYGFDKIWLLGAGLACAMLTVPIYADYAWRREKPALILAYLAVRSAARRFALSMRFREFDVILIFRAQIPPKNLSPEMIEQRQEKIELYGNSIGEPKDVWVCLLRGGIVVLSEQTGGAHLEFAAPISTGLILTELEANDEFPKDRIEIVSTISDRTKSCYISSSFPGALYVFKKQVRRLVDAKAEASQLGGRLSEKIANAGR